MELVFPVNYDMFAADHFLAADNNSENRMAKESDEEGDVCNMVFLNNDIGRIGEVPTIESDIASTSTASASSKFTVASTSQSLRAALVVIGSVLLLPH